MDSNRLARWWQEHSELDRLVEGVEQALARSAIGGANATLEQLSTTLEGHFATEEDVYFPLIERASPQHHPRLNVSRLGHQKLRERLEQLHTLVENGEVAAARRALGVLLDGFRQHEAEEAQLISELEEVADEQPGR